MVYKADTKPGKGTYICIKCGYKITLASDDEILPICPACGSTDYRKE